MSRCPGLPASLIQWFLICPLDFPLQIMKISQRWMMNKIAQIVVLKYCVISLDDNFKYQNLNI